MTARLYHVQVNVADAGTALPFYRELFTYLGNRIVSESPTHLGVSDGQAAVWVIATEPARVGRGFHRKNTGLNHLAFRVDSRDAVDSFHREFLQARGLAPLYDSPRDWPEYRPGYYAVFFEGPDRLKLEVVHVP